ncbi:hypothetical protein D3C78_1583220 [compost metagenome]
MGEGHRDEIRFAAGCVEIVPQCHVGRGAEVCDVRLRPRIRNHDQLLQRRQALEDLVDLGGLVDLFAGIAVTGAGHQHFRFDLAETVNHPLGAEVR